MFFHRQHVKNVPAIPGLFGLLLVLPGCPLSPDDSSDPPIDTRITFGRTTPEDTVHRQGEIWALQRFPEYEEILHDAFEFYVFDGDRQDFPWMTEDFWTRTDELEMARNMFDDSFSGAELPVDTIEFQYDILNRRNTVDADGPIVEITADAFAEVLVGPNDGWSSDTRFVFDLVEDPDEPGLWQIKRQREIEKL